MSEPALRDNGVILNPELGGTIMSLAGVGLMVPDPDDPDRIIVVPLAAAKLVFSPQFRGAAPKVPEGW